MVASQRPNALYRDVDSPPAAGTAEGPSVTPPDFGSGEAYAPAVMFYRYGGCEILPMCRPQLNGVRPEWGWEN